MEPAGVSARAAAALECSAKVDNEVISFLAEASCTALWSSASMALQTLPY